MIAISLSVLLLSQMLVNPAPRAWEACPTIRPLTEAEAWDFSVAHSDVIGIGRILSVHSTAPELPATVGIGALYRTVYQLSFLPDRWLKGRLPVTMQILLCSRDQLRNGDEETSFEGILDELVLVFLRKAEGDLYLFESRNGLQDGLRPIAENEMDEIAERIVLAEKRGSLDSLVAAADLVVIGTPTLGETRPCRVLGRYSHCSLLGVEETLAGANAEARIVAYGLHGALPMGRGIFFLRRTDDGIYETVPFYAGILPIQGDRVPSLGMGVSEVDFKIRRIARLLTAPLPIAPFTPTKVGGLDSGH